MKDAERINPHMAKMLERLKGIPRAARLLALFAFAGLYLTCRPGTKGPSLEIVHDLISDFLYAEIVEETRLMACGIRDANPYLLEKWDKGETGGGLWATELTVQLRFYCFTRKTDWPASLQCAPLVSADAPVQHIAVSLNGQPVVTLELEDIPQEYSIIFPEVALKYGENRVHEFIASFFGRSSKDGSLLATVLRSDALKFIEHRGRRYLYDLADDPQEDINIYIKMPVVSGYYHQNLLKLQEEWQSGLSLAAETKIDLDENVREQLRALGYIK